MDMDTLVGSVLSSIWARFYQGRDRDFHKQKHHLIKAILRYGYVCSQRGWHFDNAAIAAELASILDRIKGEQFDYLPVYLHQAVDRHVNYRAEELSAQAKALAPKVHSILRSARVVEVVHSDAELAEKLYLRLLQRKPAPRPVKLPPDRQQLLGI